MNAPRFRTSRLTTCVSPLLIGADTMVQLWAVRMAVRSRGNQAFKGGRCQLREAGIYSKDREGYNLFQSEDRIE
jgi:hypothetical protein